MQCPSCGIQNPGHSSFCVNCGVAIFADENRPHLGHYRLESKLGEGGMGVVYRAIDEKLRREVAIKVLHPHLLKHENLKERFRREARMHAKIIHPHIVTLLSLYEDGDHMALVMEMIHGKNLKEYLREHPRLDLTDIVRISEAILSGLDAAHRQGMVHRDLKPANVMLATNGGIKLMDFGLAKPKQGDDDLTQSGATVGSFRYMAPEQILNQAVDARTDLYSFGILLYQMLTGRLPFDSSSSGGEFEIMEKQVRYDPVPPIEINPNIPVELSGLVVRMLAKDKDSRPSSCEAVQMKLLEVLRQAERRSHTSQIINRPAIQPEQSSGEIARGLIRAWSRQFVRLLRTTGIFLRPWVWDKPVAFFKGLLLKCQPGASMPVRAFARAYADGRRFIATKWQGPVVWGGVAMGLLVLGWVLVSVIHVAERPVKHGTSVQPVKATQKPKPAEQVVAKASPRPVPPAGPARSAIPTKTDTKPAPAQAKPRVKPRAEPNHRPRVIRRSRPRPSSTVASSSSTASITYKVAYTVRNSLGDHINPREANEFRGGSRVYFKSLRYNRHDRYRSYSKGWVILFFDHVEHLSAVRIHRISAGGATFKGGEIELAVLDKRGHWTVLLHRKGRDIDSPMLLRGSGVAMAEVKGVRLRFRTPAPLTVGPIDLLP